MLPFIAAVAPETLKVVDVAPATFVKAPPALTCHCTVGVGLPVAAAVNIAVAPAATVTFAGLVVMVGAPEVGVLFPPPQPAKPITLTPNSVPTKNMSRRANPNDFFIGPSIS